ncbi:MAG: hypothetical protein WCO52_01650 [bacterium]
MAWHALTRPLTERSTMQETMIATDQMAQYQIKEVAVIIVAALAYVLVLGSVALAAIAICGWRGAESVSIDWVHGKATFLCRR